MNENDALFSENCDPFGQTDWTFGNKNESKHIYFLII